MKESLCGVCNQEISIHHACFVRKEDDDNKFTLYHMACEGKIPHEPCTTCKKHRLFCNESKE